MLAPAQIEKPGFWITRKVRCPQHFLLIPGRSPYKMEINPRFKNLPAWAFDKFKIKRKRPVRDKFGRPIRDYNNFYQPLKSAAYLVEMVYNPDSHICQKCKVCLEGLGKINTYAIKRLRR